MEKHAYESRIHSIRVHQNAQRLREEKRLTNYLVEIREEDCGEHLNKIDSKLLMNFYYLIIIFFPT